MSIFREIPDSVTTSQAIAAIKRHLTRAVNSTTPEEAISDLTEATLVAEHFAKSLRKALIIFKERVEVKS